METVLERMQDFQASWLRQMEQSQHREERLLNNIMDSNARMVAAVMDGIRTLQQCMMPPARSMGYGYSENHPNYHNM